MNKNVCSAESIRNCTGCGMCAACCPSKAITVKENEDGFYRPVIAEDQCVGCALCLKVCYRFDRDFSAKNEEEYECFSAVNKDERELNSASSGAVSIELMRECLNRGYYVLGVAYDTNSERAITRIAKTKEELEQFKGSKYFQSYTADAFREVVSDKSDQKYAVFGTPCQIYAFAKMAEVQKNRHKYIFVDIFCHGCPSLKLWDKYLDYVKTKNHIDKFDYINFRSKSHGWHEFCFDFVTGDKKLTSSKYNDPFYELFFGMDLMNQACYDCIPKREAAYADVRIGDFWGKRYNSDLKGVSAVVAASERGKEVFSGVASKFSIVNADYNEIIGAQSCKKTHPCDVDRREKTLALLKSNSNMKAVVRKRRKMLPMKAKIKTGLKNTLKHLPSAVYIKLKNKFGQ